MPVTAMVSVTYTHLEPMLRKTGYRFRRLGDVDNIDGIPTVVLEHEVSPDVLQACRSALLTRWGRNRSTPVCPQLSLGDPPATDPAQSALA
jgi:N-acyl-L-homoserine lactone synthetase